MVRAVFILVWSGYRDMKMLKKHLAFSTFLALKWKVKDFFTLLCSETTHVQFVWGTSIFFHFLHCDFVNWERRWQKNFMDYVDGPWGLLSIATSTSLMANPHSCWSCFGTTFADSYGHQNFITSSLPHVAHNPLTL